jgi:hypothetical protein
MPNCSFIIYNVDFDQKAAQNFLYNFTTIILQFIELNCYLILECNKKALILSDLSENR